MTLEEFNSLQEENGWANAGGSFHGNDLHIAYHDEQNQLLHCIVVGFREGKKVLVRYWTKPRCRLCGCHTDRHAHFCRATNPGR